MKYFFVMVVLAMILGCAERLKMKDSVHDDDKQIYIQYPSFEYEKQLRYSILQDTIIINRDSLR